MPGVTLTKTGGGVEKVLAILKGGHKMFWGSFYAVAFSNIEGRGGGVQNVSTL